MAATTMNGEQQGLLDASPMTRAQVLVVGVAVLLAALDGYDVLAMAFAAPAVSQDWGLGKAVVGLLLSTSLMGMAVGSIFLSPFADVIGRKPMVFAGVTLMTLGSLLSAFCGSVPELAACRVLTGVGIGLMVPLTTTLGSEFSNARNRAFAVATTTVGFAAGSVIGGLIAAVLLKQYEWPAIFLSGAVVGVVMLPVIAFGLPESPAFLITRRKGEALERLNRALARLGHPAQAALPDAPPAKRASYAALFTPAMAGVILTYAAVMVLVSSATYYMLNWMPQLIADAGYSPSQGSMVSTAPNLAGMVSGLLWGLAANRFGPARLAPVSMVGLGLAMIVFGFTPPALALLVLASAATGVFAGGCPALFYATMATTLPPLTRVSGMGFVLGVGRVFSAAGPAVAGVMFAAGLARSEVSLIFAFAPVLAGLLLFLVLRSREAAVAAA